MLESFRKLFLNQFCDAVSNLFEFLEIFDFYKLCLFDTSLLHTWTPGDRASHYGHHSHWNSEIVILQLWILKYCTHGSCFTSLTLVLLRCLALFCPERMYKSIQFTCSFLFFFLSLFLSATVCGFPVSVGRPWEHPSRASTSMALEGTEPGLANTTVLPFALWAY